MARWIDADALKEALKQNMPQYMWGEMFVTVNIQPSIDIVRCKECKHSPWHYNPQEPLDYTCIWDDDFADRKQTRDDFCSYGERRE